LHLLPEGGVVQAWLPDEEALLVGGSVSLKVGIVKRSPRVQEGEFRHQVLDVEPEAVPDERRRVLTAIALFRGAAHLAQPRHPAIRIPSLTGTPHDHLVPIPAAPGHCRQPPMIPGPRGPGEKAQAYKPGDNKSGS